MSISSWLIVGLWLLLITLFLLLGLLLPRLHNTSSSSNSNSPRTVDVTVPCGFESALCLSNSQALLYRIPRTLNDEAVLMARGIVPGDSTEDFIMNPITVTMSLEPGASLSSNDDTYFITAVSSTTDVATLTPADVYAEAFLRPTLVFPDIGTGVFRNQLFGLTLVNDSGVPLRFCLMDGAEIDLGNGEAETHFIPVPSNALMQAASDDSYMYVFPVEIKSIDGTKRATVMVVTTHVQRPFLGGSSQRAFALVDGYTASASVMQSVRFADGDAKLYSFSTLHGDAFAVTVVDGETDPSHSDMSSQMSEFLTATLAVTGLTPSPTTALASELYNHEDLAWIKANFTPRVLLHVPCSTASTNLCSAGMQALLYRPPQLAGETQATLLARGIVAEPMAEGTELTQDMDVELVLEDGKQHADIRSNDELYLVDAQLSTDTVPTTAALSALYHEVLTRPTTVHGVMGSGVWGKELAGFTLVNATGQDLKFRLPDGADVVVASGATATTLSSANFAFMIRTHIESQNITVRFMLPVEIAVLDNTKAATVLLVCNGTETSLTEDGALRFAPISTDPAASFPITFPESISTKYNAKIMNGDAFEVTLAAGTTTAVSAAMAPFMTATITVTGLTASPTAAVVTGLFDHGTLAWDKNTFQTV